MIFRAEELRTWNVSAQIHGQWVMSRPMTLHDTIPDRIKAAWLVLTGRADAVVWPEGQ